MAAAGNVVKSVWARAKWLLWLFRIHSLLTSLKEFIKIYDVSGEVMRELSIELDRICKRKEKE